MFALKYLFLVILLLVSSCAIYEGDEKLSDAQMFCSNGINFLIKDVSESDLRRAIKAAYNNKIKYGTSEDYTPLRLRDGRSLSIAKLPPEEAIKCSVRSVPSHLIDGSYVLQ